MENELLEELLELAEPLVLFAAAPVVAAAAAVAVLVAAVLASAAGVLAAAAVAELDAGLFSTKLVSAWYSALNKLLPRTVELLALLLVLGELESVPVPLTAERLLNNSD